MWPLSWVNIQHHSFPMKTGTRIRLITHTHKPKLTPQSNVSWYKHTHIFTCICFDWWFYQKEKISPFIKHDATVQMSQKYFQAISIAFRHHWFAFASANFRTSPLVIKESQMSEDMCKRGKVKCVQSGPLFIFILFLQNSYILLLVFERVWLWISNFHTTQPILRSPPSAYSDKVSENVKPSIYYSFFSHKQKAYSPRASRIQTEYITHLERWSLGFILFQKTNVSTLSVLCAGVFPVA